jgi:hypothetical protein
MAMLGKVHRSRKWRPTPKYLHEAVEKALNDLDQSEDSEKRRALGDEVYRMAVHTWDRQRAAARRKASWHFGMRAIPATAAVVAATAGGTLIGGLTGTAAAVVGVIVVVLAAVGATSAALDLGTEYRYQRDRAKDLETIGWELLTFIVLDLRATPLCELRVTLSDYQRKIPEAVHMELSDDESSSKAGNRPEN